MRLTLVLASLAILAGCATSTLQGRAALSTGHYDEAVRHFEEALVETPGRESALVGLGVARYKLGDLEGAQQALAQAAAQAPDRVTPQLYLALVAIRRDDDRGADTHLAQYLQLGAPPRLAAQLERARAALRGPVTPALREYVAASLEDAYQWAGEVARAWEAASEAHARWLVAERIYLLPRACRCR